jgi:Tfp pilus assembly protein PilV
MVDDRETGEAGETLVELLVAIVILGFAVIATLGGILVIVESSTMHRRQTLSQNGLRAWAEQISGAPYNDCATAASFGLPSPSLPSGFTPQVTAVQYWNGTAFTTSCASDTGIQKVTLRIAVANGLYPGFTQRLDVVVRKPCVSSC